MDMPLRTVKTNIVQSIRAFRVQDLQQSAQVLGHHFLYANLAQTQSKQDILDLIAKEFTFLTGVGFVRTFRNGARLDPHRYSSARS